MKFYDNLNSNKVFQFFEEISNIPHCSFDEQKISDYLVEFAKQRNLEYYQDDKLNVIIKKEATTGYESAPTIILQGHMDMVCEKNASKIHDFRVDPITHVVKGDMLFADGTTLGADNGIAVAIALAILDTNNLAHPKLECLFTVQEEVSLLGAQEVDPKLLSGKYMINIDSEEEGVFLVSCAGGCRADISIPAEWTVLDGSFEFCKLQISGLKGGHSGISIHEERGNSLKLMGRFLSELEKEFQFEIQSLDGGSKDNAIPRESVAIIAINKGDFTKLNEIIKKWEDIFNIELNGKDEKLSLSAELIDNSKISVFNQKTKKEILALLTIISNGVHTMSFGVKGLVESSKNMGVLETSSDFIKATFSIRSSVESLLFEQLNSLEQFAKTINAKFSMNGLYPGWEYNPESKLRELFLKTYQQIEKEPAKIEAIHAGLECGILKKKLGDVDIISLGPDIFDPHSPNEHVSIRSVDKVYTFILEVLKRAPELTN